MQFFIFPIKLLMRTKRELRVYYKNLRKHLSIEQIETLSLDIANNCLRLPIWNFFFLSYFF